MLRMTTATTALDDREYIAALEIETRRLQAEARRIEAQASHLSAQVRLAMWQEMHRSDAFHARHPWVKRAIMGSVALGWLAVGFAAGMALWR